MQNRITLLNEATVIRSRYSDFGNPAIPKFGIRGFPRLSHFGINGPPTHYGRRASHDYSWFGFIGLFFLFIRARMVPNCQKIYNPLKNIYF
jgi:hypothetical protein